MPREHCTEQSTDIILTTLKPQLKNVTAADVAASLYYLHLNTDDDAHLLEENSSVIAEEAELIVPEHVPRRPLPESARPSFDLSRQSTSTSQHITSQLKQPKSVFPKRKPVASVPPTRKPPSEHVQVIETVPRRPLGPRPLQSERVTNTQNFPGIENIPVTAGSSRQNQASSTTPNTEDSRTQEWKADDIDVDQHTDTFSLTVIRRDPSSGAQWNIGNVTGRPVSDDTQPRRTKAGKGSKKPHFDISIHLTTLGYNQFRGTQQNADPGEGFTVAEAGTETGKSYTNAQPNTGFDRQVRMEGSSFWNRSSTQHSRAHSDTTDAHTATRGRSSSGGSLLDLPPKLPSTDQSLDSGDGSSKGYTFISPWAGKCKFSTGLGGRSLKCRHNLPAPISARTTSDPSIQLSSVVSELRFNLPSSEIFTSSTTSPTEKKQGTSRFRTAKFGHIRNKLSAHKLPPHLPPRPHPTSYAAMYPSDDEEAPPLPPRSNSNIFARKSNDFEVIASHRDTKHRLPDMARSASEDEHEDGRLDLSMGQEKAGGGNRGKRAKLGKLIIHDEGLKMLDLLVASNMGVWWSVWEEVH